MFAFSYHISFVRYWPGVKVLWTCIRAMALSVRSVRCTSKSILFFGFLFTSLASAFAGIHISRYVHKLNTNNTWSSTAGLKLFWNYFCVGYPILIGLWVSNKWSKLKETHRKYRTECIQILITLYLWNNISEYLNESVCLDTDWALCKYEDINMKRNVTHC